MLIYSLQLSFAYAQTRDTSDTAKRIEVYLKALEKVGFSGALLGCIL